MSIFVIKNEYNLVYIMDSYNNKNIDWSSKNLAARNKGKERRQ